MAVIPQGIIIKTAAYGVTSQEAEGSRVFTNEGAGALVVFTLPSAIAGYRVRFIVQDNDGIEVDAAGGDTINGGASISSTNIGDIIEVYSINTSEWIGSIVNENSNINTSGFFSPQFGTTVSLISMPTDDQQLLGGIAAEVVLKSRTSDATGDFTLRGQYISSGVAESQVEFRKNGVTLATYITSGSYSGNTDTNFSISDPTDLLEIVGVNTEPFGNIRTVGARNVLVMCDLITYTIINP